MKYLAISLCQTDAEDGTAGQTIYTRKIAAFEYGGAAMDFAKGQDHIMIIDCDAGEVLKNADVMVGL